MAEVDTTKFCPPLHGPDLADWSVTTETEPWQSSAGQPLARQGFNRQAGKFCSLFNRYERKKELNKLHIKTSLTFGENTCGKCATSFHLFI